MNNYSLTLKIFFNEVLNPKIIKKVLNTELDKEFEKRSKTTIEVNKNDLIMKINASDSTALRASFNNYFKLVLLITKLYKITQGGN